MLRAPTQQPGPPVLGLPDDVMAEIWTGMSVPEAVTVSLVCQQWREMALRNRALWSQIQLSFWSSEDLLDSRLRQFHRDRLAMLVERSYHAYLTCNITLRAVVESKNLLDILAPLLPHGQRIASLSLSGLNLVYGQTTHALSWILHHLGAPLTALRYLTLDDESLQLTHDVEPFDLTSLGLLAMPALRELTLKVPLHWNAQDITVFARPEIRHIALRYGRSAAGMPEAPAFFIMRDLEGPLSLSIRLHFDVITINARDHLMRERTVVCHISMAFLDDYLNRVNELSVDLQILIYHDLPHGLPWASLQILTLCFPAFFDREFGYEWLDTVTPIDDLRRITLSAEHGIVSTAADIINLVQKLCPARTLATLELRGIETDDMGILAREMDGLTIVRTSVIR